MILTDEDIRNLYEKPNESPLTFARAVIAAYEAKLREQEPVAWRATNWSNDGNDYAYRDIDDPVVSISGNVVGEHLYLHPAPIPEGMVLVPIEPPDSMLVYVVGFSSQFANTNQFSDTRRSNYKAMLAAARSGE